ncbi:hypothetical protein ACFL0D_04135 [Thermoproteota archaeon]
MLKSTILKINSKLNSSNATNNQELNDFLETSDLIFRIQGLRGKKEFEKMELLLLKLLLIVMEYDENADFSVLKRNLEIIDNVRHELSFLRARYYKKIFKLKMGSVL